MGVLPPLATAGPGVSGSQSGQRQPSRKGDPDTGAMTLQVLKRQNVNVGLPGLTLLL